MDNSIYCITSFPRWVIFGRFAGTYKINKKVSSQYTSQCVPFGRKPLINLKSNCRVTLESMKSQQCIK